MNPNGRCRKSFAPAPGWGRAIAQASGPTPGSPSKRQPTCRDPQCGVSTPPSDRLVTSFHTDHGARRADPLGEEVETTPRAATNFRGSRTDRQTDLIRQPPSFLCELLGSPLQPFLFGLPVAKEVVINHCQASRWLDPCHARGQVARGWAARCGPLRRQKADRRSRWCRSARGACWSLPRRAGIRAEHVPRDESHDADDHP